MTFSGVVAVVWKVVFVSNPNTVQVEVGFYLSWVDKMKRQLKTKPFTEQNYQFTIVTPCWGGRGEFKRWLVMGGKGGGRYKILNIDLQLFRVATMQIFLIRKTFKICSCKKLTLWKSKKFFAVDFIISEIKMFFSLYSFFFEVLESSHPINLMDHLWFFMPSFTLLYKLVRMLHVIFALNEKASIFCCK